MAFGAIYVTATEFRGEAAAGGFDLGGIADSEIDTLMAGAGRLAESFCNRTFKSQAYLDEMHDWRASRRAYLRYWPVISVDAVKLLLGATASATLSPSNVLINNTSHYIELSQLALATTLTPDLLSLGLVEPVFDISYTAGFATIPDDLKIAFCIMVAAKVAQRRLVEENIMGGMNFVIGSYSVTVSRPRAGELPELAGFAGQIPEAAREILVGYRMTSVR